MSDRLCVELMVEIFTRLPPKSLLQLRSVSKSLRSLIDSPDFIRMHASRSPQRLAITHVVRVKYKKELGYDAFCTLHAEDQLPLCPISGYIGVTTMEFPCKNVNIVASCNGILCLHDFGKCGISLWNPSIMRLLTLPDCPLRCNKGLGIGIGFDPITDDNKIVSIPIYGEGIVETPFVYAMKTSTWSPIASPMPLFSRVFSRSCHLNGVLHWVVGDEELHFIMTLDLSTHVFGMIDLPKPNWPTQRLTTIHGSLAAISLFLDDTWIWVRRDAFNWSVVFKSKTNKVEIGISNALELANSGDLLLDTFYEGHQVYNPKTGARSRLVNFRDASYVYDMVSYVESLQLLGMGTTCDINRILLPEKKRVNLADTSFRLIPGSRY